MTNERKAPVDWETWADFANCYDLVLFNNCVNLMSRENGSDEGVLYEWLESHSCEAQENDYGDSPECSCEPYQWYAIGVGEWEAEQLNKHNELDIFYSNILDLYILPVYHFGTSWTHVSLTNHLKKH
jgi:hypothetical protein